MQEFEGYLEKQGEQEKRRPVEWLRTNIFNKDWFRIGIITFFTFMRDAAGLFSASNAVQNISTDVLDETWKRFVVVYVPIGFVDCVSELMIIFYHDYPLVKRDRKAINWGVTYTALVGQILTSLGWLGLAAYVVYSAIAVKCPSGTDIVDCPSIAPGLSETVVVVIVWLKNSLTLKAFYDRHGLYPIICEEQFLFYNHIIRSQPHLIIEDFKKANDLDKPKEDSEQELEPEAELDEDAPPQKTKESFFESRNFLIASHFVIMIVFDFAALASVSDLILEDTDNLVFTGLKALGFIAIVLVDITSEVMILVAHDLPLVTKSKSVHYITEFQTARVLQILCFCAWVISLGCMIWRATVYYFECTDNCRACEYNEYSLVCSTLSDCLPLGHCNNKTGVCAFNSTNSLCSIEGNGTVLYDVGNRSFAVNGLQNCSKAQTRAQCIDSHPSSTDCVLLGLVLLDTIFQLAQLFLRSYIYPITLPESVMFQVYLNWKEKAEHYRHRLIVKAVGRMEYGRNWEFKFGKPDQNNVSNKEDEAIEVSNQNDKEKDSEGPSSGDDNDNAIASKENDSKESDTQDSKENDTQDSKENEEEESQKVSTENESEEKEASDKDEDDEDSDDNDEDS